MKMKTKWKQREEKLKEEEDRLQEDSEECEHCRLLRKRREKDCCYDCEIEIRKVWAKIDELEKCKTMAEEDVKEAIEKHVEAQEKYDKAREKYKSPMEELHKKECGCKEWNEKEIIFVGSEK